MLTTKIITDLAAPKPITYPCLYRSVTDGAIYMATGRFGGVQLTAGSGGHVGKIYAESGVDTLAWETNGRFERITVPVLIEFTP